TAIPLPTFRRLIARYTVPSTCSTAARPPAALTQCPSRNMIFCFGSSRRDGARSGRRCSWSAASAIRAERFDDRTAANVARASTRVPAAVARDEITTQSTARTSIPRQCGSPLLSLATVDVELRLADGGTDRQRRTRRERPASICHATAWTPTSATSFASSASTRASSWPGSRPRCWPMRLRPRGTWTRPPSHAGGRLVAVGSLGDETTPEEPAQLGDGLALGDARPGEHVGLTDTVDRGVENL